MRIHKRMAALAVAGCVTPVVAQCQPAWSTFGLTDGYVSSMAAFDDGTGPALYVGGDFTAIGGVPAVAIAKWSQGRWSVVPGALTATGYTPEVGAMAVYDADGDGPGRPVLIIGGWFTQAGAVPARNFAAWDGTTWSALPNGPDGGALSMTIFDDDGPGPHLGKLVVGGSFYTVNGQAAAYTASWDGASWSTAYSNLGSWGWSLCSYVDDLAGPGAVTLYAGSYMHVARFQSGAWSIYGGSITGSEPRVRAMAVFDDDGAGPRRPGLYVLGDFDVAGTVPAKGIARWDGQGWEALGTGLTQGGAPATSFDAVVHDDGTGPALYAAGSFNRAGGVVVSNVAKWNGTQWSSVGAVAQSVLYAITSFDEDGAGPMPAALFTGGMDVRRWGCNLCYANCDGSLNVPLLNANDFQCFLNKFAAAESYANCDGSTQPPVLTANDFQCFLNRFAAGCP